LRLKTKAISGVKWTTFSTVFNAIIQLIQIGILARYLEVSDFGLLAIITLVIGFSNMFVDLGISSAIIHKQNVTNEQLSTLYWLNILSSFLIFFLIAISSHFIAEFYKEPRLTELIVLTSTTIIIQAFGKQFFVLFEKELKFNLIAKIEICAVSCGFLFAVYLAISGYGIYSLVLPLILVMSFKSIFFIYFGLKYHKPKFYFNFSEVKEFVVFGIYQMGSGIVNYFNSQFDIIIIGKVFGSETLGLYSIIKQLVMRPAQIINPIVTRVTFPTMSKIQDDTVRLKNIYLKTINYLSSVNFPIYIAMTVLAPEIITIFLGEKWIHGLEIFQILCIYALIRSTGNPSRFSNT
jgi:O-antigen/teichoic acid export membrane protein